MAAVAWPAPPKLRAIHRAGFPHFSLGPPLDMMISNQHRLLDNGVVYLLVAGHRKHDETLVLQVGRVGLANIPILGIWKPAWPSEMYLSSAAQVTHLEKYIGLGFRFRVYFFGVADVSYVVLGEPIPKKQKMPLNIQVSLCKNPPCAAQYSSQQHQIRANTSTASFRTTRYLFARFRASVNGACAGSLPSCSLKSNGLSD